jgi:hypothetical protein
MANFPGSLSAGPHIPLIGRPKLSDAPLLPPELAAALLNRMEVAVAQGADFASPVSVELLIVATALRDLVNLRESVALAMLENTEDAWGRVVPLLTFAEPPQARPGTKL